MQPARVLPSVGARGGSGAAPRGAIGAASGTPQSAPMGRIIPQQLGADVDARLLTGERLSSTLRQLLSTAPDQAMSFVSQASSVHGEEEEAKQQQRADGAWASDAAAEAAAEGGAAQRANGAEAPDAAAAAAPVEEGGGAWAGMERVVAAAREAMRFGLRKGLDWVQALAVYAQQPDSTISRADLQYLTVHPEVMAEVQGQAAEALHKAQLQEEELAQVAAQMQQSLRPMMQPPLGMQASPLEQQVASLAQALQGQNATIAFLQQMLLQQQGGQMGNSLAASGAPREPLASAGGGAAPAAPVVGSVRYALDYLWLWHGDPADMADSDAAAMGDRINDSMWGRAAQRLTSVCKLSPEHLVARCTGQPLEVCSRAVVPVHDSAGHIKKMEMWEERGADPRRAGSTAGKSTVATDTLGTSATAKLEVVNYVSGRDKASINLVSWGLDNAKNDPRGDGLAVSVLEDWVRDRLASHPQAYYGGELKAMLVGGGYDNGQKPITVRKDTGTYASDALGFLCKAEVEMRLLGHIPEDVPRILAQPPPLGAKGAARHHPLNGEAGAPVPLIGNRAPWTREPQGQMLVDVMLAQLMMTAVMYWVSKRSHLTESMDLAAILKSKAMAMAKAGDRTIVFPHKPEGDPFDNFRGIIKIYEGEKEWLALEDEAATVTEENRWFKTIMYPFTRSKTEGPDGSPVWTLALPPDVYKEKDVLLNIEWVRLVESFRQLVRLPSLAACTSLAEYLLAIEETWTWEYKARVLWERVWGAAAGKGPKVPGLKIPKVLAHCGHCNLANHKAVDCFSRGCDNCKGNKHLKACDKLREARVADGVPNANGVFAVNSKRKVKEEERKVKEEELKDKAGKDAKDKAQSAAAGVAALQAQAAATAAAGGPGPSLASLKGGAGAGGGGGGGRPPAGGGGSYVAAAKK